MGPGAQGMWARWACPCDPTCDVGGQGTVPRVPSTLRPCQRLARTCAYTQDDSIVRPRAFRCGLVAVDSPLGLGTRQSGSSASLWGREGRPHQRACFRMRRQPNPTQPPFRKSSKNGVSSGWGLEGSGPKNSLWDALIVQNNDFTKG